MKNLIYIIIKFTLGGFALFFGFIGLLVLFVIALPIAGWNKSSTFLKNSLNELIRK